ncbi:energy transducer TonB, partial [Roseomonas mucosa]
LPTPPQPRTAEPPPPQPPTVAEELPPPPPPAPPAPPRPAAPAPARPPAPHRAPSPFAGALDLSRGPAVNLSQAVPRPNIRPNATGQGRGLDLSFNTPSPRAPRAASPSDLGTSVRIQGANPGADWMAAFRAWLDRNGYYPQMAAMAGEDGTATVRFTVLKNGRVQDLRLVSRSGSKWLDMGAQAMLRDKTLPPFPEGTRADSTEITLTIDYILIRR